MGVLDLFSKREKRRRQAGQVEVYQYENLPDAFRVQVVHILDDALCIQPNADRWYGTYTPQVSTGWWMQLFGAFTREKGVFHLANERHPPCYQFLHYLMTSPTEDALDAIEFTFAFLDRGLRSMEGHIRQELKLTYPDEAIAELNQRFREHRIGYAFSNEELIRVDSQYLHAEAIIPAIHLLNTAGSGFSGPLEEFMRANELHRSGEQKDSIVAACRAFESTLKAICIERGWKFDAQKATANPLLKIVFEHNLIPDYLQTYFAGIRSVLESGIPTIRNKTSGHGQGPIPTVVPDHFATFALHITASSIVLLIECHKAMK